MDWKAAVFGTTHFAGKTDEDSTENALKMVYVVAEQDDITYLQNPDTGLLGKAIFPLEWKSIVNTLVGNMYPFPVPTKYIVWEKL